MTTWDLLAAGADPPKHARYPVCLTGFPGLGLTWAPFRLSTAIRHDLLYQIGQFLAATRVS